MTDLSVMTRFCICIERRGACVRPWVCLVFPLACPAQPP